MGKKLNQKNQKIKAQIKNTIYKAKSIVVEELTAPITGSKLGKNTNRKLSAWTKGAIAKALDNLFRRGGSTVILVNSAYTSQMDSRYGILLGKRNRDSFYCFDGLVLQADENAARNVFARLYDLERVLIYTFSKGEIHFARTD